MRLLKLNSDDSISLTESLVENYPPYAILSHTWGGDQDECTFDDLAGGIGKSKAGYAKIQFCGQQARKDGLEYFWVDTCCINKASHVELAEAINSMFRWYLGAKRCYVYLSDVSAHKRNIESQTEGMWVAAFRTSRWFTRGWTLQELLAPDSVEFFSREGELLGSKRMLYALIQEITEIPLSALQGAALSSFSVNERMRWAAKRNTKRPEDKVYCLLGILNVFMLPIYGEGENALIRLKDEIVKSYRSQLDDVRSSFVAPACNTPDDHVTNRREKLLESLYFEQMDERRSTIKGAYSTTCQWFLKHTAYIDWTDASKYHKHQGFLWIKGKPGAGKSTMVKFLHTHFETTRTEDDLIVSFYFHARGSQLERSTIGMYRGLLFQVFTQATDLQDVLDEFHRPSSHQGWRIEELQELFSIIKARLQHRQLTCFIDALDECDEQQVMEMVFFFEELGRSSLNNGDQLYICFASRHYPTIDIRSCCTVTLENERAHDEDVEQYVHNHLRAGKGEYIDRIRAHVLSKANGVFLWAVLVVDILNREFLHGRIFAVQKRLDEIPTQLSDLFKDSLGRDRSNMNELLLCLQWILFAEEPLQLEEFYFAMAAGIDPAPENLASWNPRQITTQDMGRFLHSSSRGLAGFTQGGAVVQFIHESVRDFFIKGNGLCELWPELGGRLYSSSHDNLKRCCLDYLRATSSRYGLLNETREQYRSLVFERVSHPRLPFLRYASKNVLFHANEAARDIPQDSFLREADFVPLLTNNDPSGCYNIAHPTPHESLLYILAAEGHTNLIKTMRRMGFAMNVRGGQQQFPLFAALSNGHHEAVRALLHSDKHAATGNITKDLEFGPKFWVRKDQTPLLWALEREHETIAEILVMSIHVDLDVLNRKNRNALSLAAEKGYTRVVDFLLSASTVEPDLGDILGQTPLSYAAQTGRTAIVQMLLERGANVHAQDLKRYTPLSYAAQNGHTVVVRLLLDKGANIEAAVHDGGTGLLCAARKGHESAVQLLIDRGANIEATNGRGQTALSLAASAGQEAVVRFLIDSGAFIEAQDDTGKTALIWAAYFAKTKVMEILVAKSANIEARDEPGRTPLSYASQFGSNIAVQLLLASNARVDNEDNEGKTALLWVLERNGPAVGSVRYAFHDHEVTLDHGEQEKLRLIWNQHESLSNNRIEIMWQLLDKGARLDATSSDGKTALMVATEKGWGNAVQMLQQYAKSTS